MTKSKTIAGILAERIRRGDYILSNLQSDRRVAEEFTVSRVTARHALRHLVEMGILQRKDNGRLEMAGTVEGPAAPRTVAFLAPSFHSPFIQGLRVAAERCATAAGMRFRPVDYLHWTDQVLFETLSRFDGVILAHVGEKMPELVFERMLAAKAGILSISRDLSQHGIPSLIVNPPGGVHTLLDHLAALGHRRIDCLQVHPPSVGLAVRMQQWELWRHAHGVEGDFHELTIESYGDPRRAAYDFTRTLLAGRKLRGTAVFCTTEMASIGAARAFEEAGITLGQDLSLCTFGGDGFCRFATPSITSLEFPPLEPYLRLYFDRLASPTRGWLGPLLMEPADTLFQGESSAPPGGWPDGRRRRTSFAAPVPQPVVG